MCAPYFILINILNKSLNFNLFPQCNIAVEYILIDINANSIIVKISIAIEPIISSVPATPAKILLGIENGEDKGKNEANALNLLSDVIVKNDMKNDIIDINDNGKFAICVSSVLLTVAPVIAFKKEYIVKPNIK